MLDDLSNELGDVPALEGLNATNLSTLDSQAQVLRSGAEAIIQSMNARYDEDFIFAGSDNQEAPFAIDADGLSPTGASKSTIRPPWATTTSQTPMIRPQL